ncbi:MAG: hypothetical protein KN64_04015 [Sulfurovum sp. AS07-7]|nr:MAG: hypothetical protein KN64_04015 [Sulfurovum sp. AS07-7]
MKKVSIMIDGKVFDIDLEDKFAEFLMEDLKLNKISLNKENKKIDILRLYLKTLRDNFNIQEHLEIAMIKLKEKNNQ